MRIPTLGRVASALSLSPVFQKAVTMGPSSELTDAPLPLKADIPGGTPFRFCNVSRSTDLFAITSVELTKQPLYIDDVFFVHLYGVFQDSFTDTSTANATLSVTGDCGSHCDEYGVPPDERKPSEAWTPDFCDMSEIEQPLGGRKKNATCPPEKGYALITSPGYVFPMFINFPGWYNFTFDAKTAQGERIYCLTAEVCLRWEDENKNKHYPPGPWNNCTWP